MDLDSEIDVLKNKIIELENRKQKEKEHNEKNNIYFNLDIIQSGIDHRTNKVNTDNYSKSCISNKFIDQIMIPQLQAIHNILVVLNERIDKLEAKIIQLSCAGTIM